jgi:hypothetical protein
LRGLFLEHQRPLRKSASLADKNWRTRKVNYVRGIYFGKFWGVNLENLGDFVMKYILMILLEN